MSHHIVEVSKIEFIYPDGHKAIKDISFKIHHGESVAIIGANGAGKSTLLMLLMGVLFPNNGNISIGEILVTKKTLKLIRQSMGMVFQDADDQLFMNSVYEDVAFGPRNYGLSEEEVSTRVNNALHTVGILHLKDRPPYKLSGGEKRAAAIASILSMKPDILVMDEPTSGLDPKARRRLMGLLKSFSHTKIITTHDMDMVMEICDRVILLRNGTVAADGKTIDILMNRELMDECGLEIPLGMQKCPVCSKMTLYELSKGTDL